LLAVFGAYPAARAATVGLASSTNFRQNRSCLDLNGFINGLPF
jgi:hypothetical protein